MEVENTALKICTLENITIRASRLIQEPIRAFFRADVFVFGDNHLSK